MHVVLYVQMHWLLCGCNFYIHSYIYVTILGRKKCIYIKGHFHGHCSTSILALDLPVCSLVIVPKKSYKSLWTVVLKAHMNTPLSIDTLTTNIHIPDPRDPQQTQTRSRSVSKWSQCHQNPIRDFCAVHPWSSLGFYFRILGFSFRQIHFKSIPVNGKITSPIYK